MNCYAERQAVRFSGKGGAYEGLVRIANGHPQWTGKVEFVEKHLLDPLRWKKPRMIFVNSMSDLFHENVPDEWIDKIFAVMQLSDSHRSNPRNHRFQVLTKRPQRMRKYLTDPDTPFRISAQITKIVIGWTPQKGGCDWKHCEPWPLDNLWLGVSVENQKTADERIPLLMETPGAIRWISYEPALAAVDLLEIPMRDGDHLNRDFCWYDHDADRSAKLDWIVCGGESGPGARPFNIQWARDVRDQCKAAGVPFFMKQMGSFVISSDDRDWIGHKGRIEPTDDGLEERWHILLSNRKGGDWHEWPYDLRIREFPK